MSLFVRLSVVVLLAFAPVAALADQGELPIKADDGTVIANHRVTAELESRIEKLPGAVVAGNPRGKVTIAEFYDVNCPYCRVASADIDALLRSNPELRLVLVPFPVLGLPSFLGTRVELAVARLAPKKFYEFHRRLDALRGVVDGTRVLAVAKAMGLDVEKVTSVANEDSLADVMKAHIRLGDALAIQATPGFVIKGVAIVGYPGPKALAGITPAGQRGGAVVAARQNAQPKPGRQRPPTRAIQYPSSSLRRTGCPACAGHDSGGCGWSVTTLPASKADAPRRWSPAAGRIRRTGPPPASPRRRSTARACSCPSGCCPRARCGNGRRLRGSSG